MIWPMSVFSLMPKGEIVGIKSVFPLVTTLRNIISLSSSSLCIVHTEQSQYLPGD